QDKKKEVKVAVLTYVPLETRAELVRADRELSEYLAGHIREYAKANELKITLVPTKKVHEYLNQHPSWKDLEPEEIGKGLGVDYLIYLEIEDLGLYKKDCFNTF